MNPVSHIRKSILRQTQAGLAKALGVTQPTVQRWEKEGSFPSDHQFAIREMGKKARMDWSDSWFFEVPEDMRADEAA